MNIQEELTSTIMKMRCLAETFETDAHIGFRRGRERSTGSLINGLADEIEFALNRYADDGAREGRGKIVLKTA
ncbi:MULTISPECIES: hypothetical protein [Desulfococcus]|uniref:Uncharacterized protein n=1 Tax=Desulfococcus multivorans DSM 2059 TaxID=1121405 RepID=S7V8C6_DESML|nr:hypothetical protein [Desulfococcus multivorans]AOY57020.1 uncharacterized protein Dmul_02440 [Desulfococcus multivorans]AQU99536.1 hypothetical protein B2D07_01220 [Desulfococcus multivorans]EPR42909.1 hypothetical protein dsmv_1492 [Desulfococcus multivorans DSM 2059]SJZ89429.1 hypothetical protein SAMN02745446_02002 [Desulfococcus multivorans DSM 2059]